MKVNYIFKCQNTVKLSEDYTLTSIADPHRIIKALMVQIPLLKPVRLGLSELLINAVEHGNLGISYDDKTKLKKELGIVGYDNFLNARITSEPWCHMNVTLCIEEFSDRLITTIQDQGKGFDWKKRIYNAEDIAFKDNHGAGILVELKKFNALTYQGCGNIVQATVAKSQINQLSLHMSTQLEF